MDHSQTTARGRHGRAHLIALLLLSAALVLTLFVFTGSAAAYDAPDQQQAATDGDFVSLNSPIVAAQTFTASQTAPLGKISVYIGGASSSSYLMQAQIWSTSDGVPSTVLATTQLTVFSAAKHWQDISFTPAPTLTAGAHYAIVLRWVGNNYVWYDQPSDPYVAGGPYDNGGYGWFQMGSYDQCFKTYYYVDDTTAPVVTAPDDVTVDATGDAGAAVNFGSGSAVDDMDGALPASSIHYYTGYGTDAQIEVSSGDTFPTGTTTVTAAATDSSGNTGTATFTISVREPYVEVLDQREQSQVSYQYPADPSYLWVQTFSPGHTAPLTKVSFYISNQYAGSYDAQAEICSWSTSGAPTGVPADGQILATTTVHFSSASDGPYWQDFTFDTPPTLTAGTQYAIVLSGVHFDFYQQEGDYPAGMCWSWNGTKWANRRGADFMFRTYSLVHQGTPTDITLDNSCVDENLPAGTTVGSLSTADPNSGDRFSYSLVDGVGSADNASFTLSADGTLRTAASFDFETQSRYLIRVRSTDSAGLSDEKVFVININDVNEPPTDITFGTGWDGSVDEHQPIGTLVVPFDTVDPDWNDTYTYALVSGEGDTDNASFAFDEYNEHDLVTAAVFDYATKSSYAIRVRSTDAAGYSVEKAFTITVHDKTAPVTSCDAPSGWQNGEVRVHFSATDASGVARTYYTLDGGAQQEGSSVTVSGDGIHPLTFWSVDNAGNVEAANSTEVKIDTVAPDITVGTPAAGAVYTLNQAVSAAWEASDATSGVDDATAAPGSGSLIDTDSVGSHTFTVSVKDKAGNEGKATVSYSVQYAYSGVLQPINADGSSIFKAGSTVPVKFQLTDADGAIVPSAVASIGYAKLSNNIAGDEVEAVSTAAATTGNLFRYDATAQQYIFNWSTKGLASGTYQLKITLNDGATYTVRVGLK